MTFYGSLAATAANVLRGYGNAVSSTLARTTPGEYDSSSLSTGAGTVETVSVDAFLESSSLQTLGSKFGESMVRESDAMATLSAQGLPFVPDAGDTLTTSDGTVWTVKAVRATPAGPNPVLFEALVRR